MTNRDQWACAKCFKETICKLTDDPTARSDALRAHRAWSKGYDRTTVRGVKVDVPLGPPTKLGISYQQYVQWRDAMLHAGMLSGTMAAYESATGRCWVACDCPHSPTSSPGAPATPFAGRPDASPPFFDSSAMVPRRPYPSTGSGSASIDPFADLFDDDSDQVSEGRTGFKLSVAQKFSSLLLKHAWVNGFIDEPPVCPVDRIILDAASRITGRGWRVPWTQVNRIEDYDAHLQLVTEAAGYREIAAWELLAFEGLIDTSPYSRFATAQDIEAELAADAETRIELAKQSFMHRFGKGNPGHEKWARTMLTDALKSSLQRNPLYLPNTPESIRREIRDSMRQWGIDFLRRWKESEGANQGVEQFRSEILAFRDHMNENYSSWFQ